ncbi:MAG: hypothetical protein K8J09_15490 [Planctomycetes bacterium]|nr:hypothetical protein [Planctomycetota bacterium]
MNPKHLLRPALACVVFSFAGCTSTGNLLYEPAPTDPLDGYKGILSQAGTNTEMDWGPKQEYLLTEFRTLKNAHAELERRCEDLRAENGNLKNQLGSEASKLQREQSLRVQAEEETDLLRRRRRDLEARLLSLSIEKAKLEQENLVAKIAGLKARLEQASATPMEAAATPPVR